MDPSYIESAKLFTKYQMLVHNEKPYECDTESFQDFLVSTPLQVKFIPCPCLTLSIYTGCPAKAVPRC